MSYKPQKRLSKIKNISPKRREILPILKEMKIDIPTEKLKSSISFTDQYCMLNS